MNCPECGSKNTKLIIGNLYRCGDCGNKFTEKDVKDEMWKQKVEHEESEQECKLQDIDPDDEEDDTGDNVGDPDDMDAMFMGVL